MIKKLCTCLLLISLVLGCIPYGLSAVSPLDEAQSVLKKRLTMSVDSETCVLTVTDSVTGDIWTTNPDTPTENQYTKSATLNDLKSQMVVSYYDLNNKKTVIGSYLSSVKRKTFKITQKENYIRIDYDFSRPNEKFRIPVEYTVNGDKLSVRILIGEIKEYGEVKICEISLLPYFARGTLQDDGYILIPDGSGALIDLNTVNTSALAYKQRVYGRDCATSYYYSEGAQYYAMLPVFGIERNGRSLLAIIDSNESAASVNAECIGITSSYSRVYSSFVYRAYDTVTISGNDWRYKEYVTSSEHNEEENFGVSFYAVGTGGYSAMAAKYREEVINEQDLKVLSQHRGVTGAIRVYGCTSRKTSFLGIPYTETVTATDFDDLGEIIGSLSKENSMKFAVFLQDFDIDAVKENYPSSLSWSAKVGGKKAFNSLYKRFGYNNRFYQIKNVIYRKPSVIWLEQSKYSQMVGKDYIRKQTYSRITYAAESTGLYGLSQKYLLRYSAKLLRRLSKSSSEVGIALENMGYELYSDYNKKSFVSRQDMKSVYRKITKGFSGTSVPSAVDGGNAYEIGCTDTVYNIPTSSSGFILETVSIPFYQMAFHGYVNIVSECLNMTDDPDIELLKCVESGTIPCYGVTGMRNGSLRRTEYKQLFRTCFNDNKENIEAPLQRVARVIERIYNIPVASHRICGELTETTYENGIKVYVNYSDSPAALDGVTVPARDFTVI